MRLVKIEVIELMKEGKPVFLFLNDDLNLRITSNTLRQGFVLLGNSFKRLKKKELEEWFNEV